MDFNSALQNVNMRIAVIDIGTNTILMLIGDVDNEGNVNFASDHHRIARLGKGVDARGIIQEETIIRVLDILSELKKIAYSEKSEKIFAFGTSALRNAKNNLSFIELIKNRLSIDIQILSNSDEARLTYLGAISDYPKNNPTLEYAVLDIGGGSTELTYGNGNNIIEKSSIEIGSVRLTERLLYQHPPSLDSIESAKKLIEKEIAGLCKMPKSVTSIGVAGTLTTLATIDLGLNQFDADVVHKHILKLENLECIFNRLKMLSLEELAKQPQIHPLRADIILAGTLILIEIMKKYNLNTITVSTRGLRFGILIDLAMILKEKGFLP